MGDDITLDSATNSVKRDWIRRFNNFAENYLNGDLKQAEYCLKDSYLLHKWNKINQNFVPIDWVEDLTEKRYTEVDTMGAAACAGGACEIDF
jgi:ribonucleoside-triphosphate reductase